MIFGNERGRSLCMFAKTKLCLLIPCWGGQALFSLLICMLTRVEAVGKKTKIFCFDVVCVCVKIRICLCAMACVCTHLIACTASVLVLQTLYPSSRNIISFILVSYIMLHIIFLETIFSDVALFQDSNSLLPPSFCTHGTVHHWGLSESQNKASSFTL